MLKVTIDAKEIACLPPAGQQEDEEDAGGGAASEEGAGESRAESPEEHGRPDLGRDEPLIVTDSKMSFP